MSNLDDKISQIYAVLSSTNTRYHENAQAIEQLNAEIAAVNAKISQLNEQVNQAIAENRQEQEDLKQMTRQHAEWREQVLAMQADITLILRHLNQEIGDTADGGEVR